jgi:hypothetical protein
MSFVKLQVANSYHGVLIIINCDDERAFVGHIKINQSKQAKVYHQGFLNLFFVLIVAYYGLVYNL